MCCRPRRAPRTAKRVNSRVAAVCHKSDLCVAPLASLPSLHLPVAGFCTRSSALIAFAAHNQLQPVWHRWRWIRCVSGKGRDERVSSIRQLIGLSIVKSEYRPKYRYTHLIIELQCLALGTANISLPATTAAAAAAAAFSTAASTSGISANSSGSTISASILLIELSELRGPVRR